MECETVREQLEEYALGLLDEETQQSIAQHLSTCAECQRLLAEYADSLATLPSALATVSPHALPDEVKSRLLARVTSSSDVPARLPPSATTHGGSHWSAPLLNLRPTNTRNAHLLRLRIALVAAALLLALAVAWSIRLNVALARERALRAEFMDLVGHQQELVLEVVDSNDTTRHILRSPTPDSRAYGKLFTRAGLTHVVAMAARLPAPPAGQNYHLWLTRNAQTELAGVLQTNSAGFGLLIHEAESEQPVYEAAEVTLQPAGSTSPAGETVLIWRAADD